jgi:hypothetical protein
MHQDIHLGELPRGVHHRLTETLEGAHAADEDRPHRRQIVDGEGLPHLVVEGVAHLVEAGGCQVGEQVERLLAGAGEQTRGHGLARSQVDRAAEALERRLSRGAQDLSDLLPGVAPGAGAIYRGTQGFLGFEHLPVHSLYLTEGAVGGR